MFWFAILSGSLDSLVPGAVQFAMWSSCPCFLRSLVLYVAWFAILSGSLDPFLLRHGPAHENPVRRSVGLDLAMPNLDTLGTLDVLDKVGPDEGLTRIDCWICPGQLLKRSKIRPISPKRTADPDETGIPSGSRQGSARWTRWCRVIAQLIGSVRVSM